MADLLPWVCSGLTLGAQYAVGRTKWWGWALYMASAVAFTALAIAIRSWGLMPLNVVSFAISARNLRAWYPSQTEPDRTEPSPRTPV